MTRYSLPFLVLTVAQTVLLCLGRAGLVHWHWYWIAVPLWIGLLVAGLGLGAVLYVIKHDEEDERPWEPYVAGGGVNTENAPQSGFVFEHNVFHEGQPVERRVRNRHVDAKTGWGRPAV